MGNKIKDNGNKCIECMRDTSLGTGLFVNRIPADKYTDDGLMLIEGYMCSECQMIECDNCGGKTLDYYWVNKESERFCDDCMKKTGN